MYITIAGKFFDKNRTTAKETNIQNIGKVEQQEEDTLQWDDLNTTIEEMDISEDEITLAVANKLGYFSIDIPLDSSIIEQIIQVAIKKMNKIKALLENMK